MLCLRISIVAKYAVLRSSNFNPEHKTLSIFRLMNLDPQSKAAPQAECSNQATSHWLADAISLRL